MENAIGMVLAGRRVALLDRARIYTCGITPYDVTHLGHASTFVWVDALARVLRRFFGVEPIVCRNVTDVDDVLSVAARQAGVRYDDFAAFHQFVFEGDMAALNVRAPEHEPWVHRYIGAVVRMAGALAGTGAAYVRDGSVYFRGRRVLERSELPESEALELFTEYGGRPGDPAKDDPFDVAMWQAAEPGYPAWPSPWGEGRPGWHAECAAMSLSIFGPAVDIHAGGADLRFPHHAYHAAMAEEFTGVAPYARARFHAPTVTVSGEKMAKSAGNLVLLSDLLSEWSAAVVRLLILDRPWSRPWDYEPGLLDSAATRLESLHRAAGRGDTANSAGLAAIRRVLGEEFDLSAALDIAIETGGEAARALIPALGLS